MGTQTAPVARQDAAAGDGGGATPLRDFDPQVPAGVRIATLQRATGEEAAILAIPYDPGNASPNLRRHWRERHAEAETARTAAMWAYREAGEPVNTEPVVVDALVLRGRVMDEDNLRSGLKHVADFFNTRLWPDDGPRWVRWGTLEQITGEPWKGSRAWVVLFVLRRLADPFEPMNRTLRRQQRAAPRAAP